MLEKVLPSKASGTPSSPKPDLHNAPTSSKDTAPPKPVAEITLVLGAHTEKLFLYVTGLQHYPVVLDHPWLHKHEALADFAYNVLSLSFEFYLNNCALAPVKIKAITSDQEKFMLPAEVENLQPDPAFHASDMIEDQSDTVHVQQLLLGKLKLFLLLTC